MPQHPILFSIVVPTYNRGHLIVGTIVNILAQTYPHFELIIVDDGSTDNTEEVIQKYLSDKVLYFKKDNAERAAARNYGTQKAKGDYVNWFDSDDMMYPHHLQEALKVIERYDRPEIFAHSYEHRSASGQVLETYIHSDDINAELILGNRIGNSPVMVRRDIAFTNPYNEDRGLSGSEDYELWLRLAAQYKIYSCPQITLAVIFHQGNSTLTMSNPDQLVTRYTRFIHYTTANEKLVTFLGKQKNTFVMKNYLLLAVDLVINKHQTLARKYLKMAFDSSSSVLIEKGFLVFIKYYAKNIFS